MLFVFCDAVVGAVVELDSDDAVRVVAELALVELVVVEDGIDAASSAKASAVVEETSVRKQLRK